MELSIQIVLLVLNVINVVLHSIGIRALITVYSRCRQKQQRLYIINLSFCELLMNLIEFVRNILNMISFSPLVEIKIAEARHYVLIIAFTGISLVYYIDMIVLTLDRLAIVVLGMRYPKYWNTKKAKQLMISLWIIGLIVCTLVSILYKLCQFDWESIFFMYFYPICEFTFMIVAIATYITIRHKSNKSARDRIRRLSSRNDTTRASIEAMNLYRRSIFQVPLLLIITFFCFMTVPDITYLFVAIIFKKPSETLSNVCWISYSISNILDAGIYIYFYPDVRAHVKKMLFRVTKQEHSSYSVKRSSASFTLRTVPVELNVATRTLSTQSNVTARTMSTDSSAGIPNDGRHQSVS